MNITATIESAAKAIAFNNAVKNRYTYTIRGLCQYKIEIIAAENTNKLSYCPKIEEELYYVTIPMGETGRYLISVEIGFANARKVALRESITGEITMSEHFLDVNSEVLLYEHNKTNGDKEETETNYRQFYITNRTDLLSGWHTKKEKENE